MNCVPGTTWDLQYRCAQSQPCASRASHAAQGGWQKTRKLKVMSSDNGRSVADTEVEGVHFMW